MDAFEAEMEFFHQIEPKQPRHDPGVAWFEWGVKFGLCVMYPGHTRRSFSILFRHTRRQLKESLFISVGLMANLGSAPAVRALALLISASVDLFDALLARTGTDSGRPASARNLLSTSHLTLSPRLAPTPIAAA